MKERLNSLLSEVGESFDYLKSDVRNLGRYLAELEALIEDYRTFATNATFSNEADQVAMRKLLKRTRTVLGAPLDEPKDVPEQADASCRPAFRKLIGRGNGHQRVDHKTSL